MADLLGVLDTSSRALLVTQKGVSVAGHNIANVNTPGYSRQRQVLEASRPAQIGGSPLGTGVESAGVERITSGFIQRQLEQEKSSLGSLEAQAESLRQIDTLLNEQQAEGIAAQLSQLYRAFGDLANAAAPGAPTERAALRSVAQTLVDSIRSADVRLRQQQRAVDRDLVAMLPEINDLASEIAALNADIARESNIATPNDLLDRRDQLVLELAKRIDISSFEQESGTVVVMVAGGVPLVDGTRAGRLEERSDTANPFDPTYSRIYFTDGSNDFEVTPDIGGGELGGMLRARDTILADAIRTLDTLAYNLADSVNEQHRAGFGLDAVGGRDFFVAPAAIEDAANTLSLAFTDLDHIAAAGQPGGGSTDNENALALAQLEYAPAATFQVGDVLAPGGESGPTATIIDLAASMQADVGQQVRRTEAARAQQELVLESIQNRRDELSGVSLDEEMTNLVRLQATFQANARVISLVNRLLDDVLGLL